MAEPMLAGVTIANCTKCDRKEIFHGKQERAHDGTLLVDYTAVKYKWSIEAMLLTKTQRDTIKAKVDVVTVNQSFTDTDGDTYTVQVKRGSYDEQRMPGADLYAMTFELEQV